MPPQTENYANCSLALNSMRRDCFTFSKYVLGPHQANKKNSKTNNLTKNRLTVHKTYPTLERFNLCMGSLDASLKENPHIQSCPKYVLMI